jgi:hypothetical protein
MPALLWWRCVAVRLPLAHRVPRPRPREGGSGVHIVLPLVVTLAWSFPDATDYRRGYRPHGVAASTFRIRRSWSGLYSRRERLANAQPKSGTFSGTFWTDSGFFAAFRSISVRVRLQRGLADALYF